MPRALTSVAVKTPVSATKSHALQMTQVLEFEMAAPSRRNKDEVFSERILRGSEEDAGSACEGSACCCAVAESGFEGFASSAGKVRQARREEKEEVKQRRRGEEARVAPERRVCAEAAREAARQPARAIPGRRQALADMGHGDAVRHKEGYEPWIRGRVRMTIILYLRYCLALMRQYSSSKLYLLRQY